MNASAISVFFIVTISASLYFIPSIIAANRKHHNSTAIFVVNLFFGWTVLGWVAALVWAIANPPPRVS